MTGFRNFFLCSWHAVRNTSAFTRPTPAESVYIYTTPIYWHCSPDRDPYFLHGRHHSVTQMLQSRDGVTAQMAKSKFVETVYQSENYIAIDKEYDIKVNSDDNSELTVETQLTATYPEFQDSSLKHGFRFTHRLDYATSVVLCLSLSKKAAKHLHKAFAERKVVKHYLALVRGHVDFDVQEVDQALGRDGNETFNKMCASYSPNCTDPRPAVTKLVKLETGHYANQPATKLLLIPQTGRTHQLRVHCVHIGHPIIGDYTYSNRTDTDPFRMMLHSYRLITDSGLEDLDICAPDPFIPQADVLWKPDHVFRTYKKYIADLKTNQQTEPPTVLSMMQTPL